MSLPTVPGYYWVNFPNHYGWEVVWIYYTTPTSQHKYRLLCLRVVVREHFDSLDFATQIIGPLEQPIW